MKFQHPLLFISSLLSVATGAAVPYNFRLLAITPRGVTPRIADSVDIVDGVVGANRTAAAIFRMDRSPMQDLPIGRLSTADSSSVHLHSDHEHPGFWDLVVGHESDDDGLETKFRMTDLSCGFGCGGLQLVYGPGRGQGRTEWMAVPDGDGWVVKWWGKDTPPEGIPGGVGVWLVREGV